jgi:hypothetical protein
MIEASKKEVGMGGKPHVDRFPEEKWQDRAGRHQERERFRDVPAYRNRSEIFLSLEGC